MTETRIAGPTAAGMPRRNPWLGLESYREGEVLYGRDDDIRSLSQSVLKDRETLLFGKSGIGKSSILNAGILPTARRSGFTPVIIRLSHKDGRTYLQQIDEALEIALGGTDGCDGRDKRVREVVYRRETGRESLYEYFHRHTFHGADGERSKLLVVFDQFEEIFTLQTEENRKKAFFSELADMLNDIMPQYMQPDAVPLGGNPTDELASLDELPVDISLDDVFDTPQYVDDNECHFVFTIREDFLSEFEYYTATIPSLKHNRYNLRPINEEQAAQIILRPIPGLVSQEVAKLIIEKVTGRTDFLLDGIPEIEVDSAVLSLYLNRLYEACDGKAITAMVVEERGGEIISEFYHEAISGISESSVEYLEDMLLNGQGRRDNITVGDAKAEGGVTDEELSTLCDRKKILRQFNYAGDLRIEYVHDILCPVVKAHKENRIMARRQEAERQRILHEEEEKRRLLELEAEKERERMQAEARQARSKNRKRMMVVGSVFALLLVSMLFYAWYFVWPRDTYYADFQRIEGWPSGVGEPLSKEQRATMPLYYRLSHVGYLSHDTEVEVCSSNKHLPLYPRVDRHEAYDGDAADAKAAAYNGKLTHVRRIHFVGGENNVIEKEVFYDERDSVLFIKNYFHINNHEAWIQFVAPSGEPMQIRDNGVDRIHVDWYNDTVNIESDFYGKVASITYYDEKQVSRPISNATCGFVFRYDRDTTLLHLMDEYGRVLKGGYNTIRSEQAGDTLVTSYWTVTDVSGTDFFPSVSEGGYHMCKAADGRDLLYDTNNNHIATRTLKKDDCGNVLEETIEGKVDADIPYLYIYTYDKATGYKTSEAFYDSSNRPFPRNGVYKKTWQYDNNGNITREVHLAANNSRMFLHSVTKNGKVDTDTLINVQKGVYQVRVDSTLAGNKTSTSFYGDNHAPIITFSVENFDTVRWHRKVVSVNADKKTSEYFTVDNGSIVPVETTSTESSISYFRKIEQFDRDGNCINYQLFDIDGNIFKSMMMFYQNGRKIARAVMGVDGTPVRCPNWEWEGYAYYKLYFGLDINNSFASIAAVNEWGTPSTFFSDVDSQYLTISYKDYRGHVIGGDYDGYPRIILNPYSQYLVHDADNISATSCCYLHILDKRSALYQNQAFKDGDRIIELGGWRQGEAEAKFSRQWDRCKTEALSITVLRPTPAGFKRVSSTILLGDNHFEEYHFYKLTKEEESEFNKLPISE